MSKVAALVELSDLYFSWFSKLPIWNNDLKFRSLAWVLHTSDGQFGDREGFPGKEKPDVSVLAVPVIKNILFLLGRNTRSVIFADDDQSGFCL
jgi:hypothetical protein